MVWNREEYIAHMTFENIGKEMFTEQFGPLAALDKEWIAAGEWDKIAAVARQLVENSKV